MIYLLQCKCPQNHCILAMCFDDADMSTAEAEYLFREQVELWITAGLVNRRCEMCSADVVLHFECASTVFRTMAEAKPVLEAAQEAQRRTAAMMKASRN